LIDKIFNKIVCANLATWDFVLKRADAGDGLAQGIVALCYGSDEMSLTDKDIMQSQVRKKF
jgi:hypothetical protein